MLPEIVPPLLNLVCDTTFSHSNTPPSLNQVREATSNDPWGPSSSLMSEIADLTFNVVAFAEVMGMVWKRLNDHGKNWRHVYKVNTFK
uniref:ENTH domain-containing protein n=1 Tax=Oncorhynchus mykiss TaxID=8022 RepID=A0A8K9Y5J6_ONCMY